MKKIIFNLMKTLLVFSMLLTFGCSKNDPSIDHNADVSFTIGTTANQTVYADETPTDVSFITKGAWTSSISASWITISPDHGNAAGTNTISISLEPNTTGSDRSATINILCNGTTITAKVIQKATNKDGTKYDPNIPKSSDVYVAGSIGNYAVLWKNGVSQLLTDGKSHASAFSVYVLGNDVYVVGYKANLATVWKNGVVQYLNNGDSPAYANSVYVSGNDVYVAGEIYDGAHYTATLWKNGEAQTLGCEYASSVYVSGSDVYVAGYNAGGYGFLWKNGIMQTLPFELSSPRVFVSGNDVYVAGAIDNHGGILWKNGVVQDLSATFYGISSIYILENDVYLAGAAIVADSQDRTSWHYVATLCKNGVVQNITINKINPNDLNSLANSVFVSGNTVYIAGTNGGQPAIWKNGEVQQITTSGGSANSVFVVK